MRFWVVFRSERAVWTIFPPYFMPNGTYERIKKISDTLPLKINHIRSCAKTFPRGLGHGCSLCAEFLPRGQSVGELSTNDCLRVLIDLFCLLDGSLGAKLGGD